MPPTRLLMIRSAMISIAVFYLHPNTKSVALLSCVFLLLLLDSPSSKTILLQLYIKHLTNNTHVRTSCAGLGQNSAQECKI